MKRFNRFGYAGFFFKGLVMLCATLAHGLGGATFVWDNGGSGTQWGTAQNWAGNAVPASASNTILRFGTGSAANNNLGNFTLEELFFDSGLGGGNFAMTGDDLTFGGTRDIEILHTGSASVSNNITISNNLQFYGNNGATLTMSGDIGGSGFVTKFDDHTLILSGDNSFNNRIRIRGGIVESQAANSLGGASRIDFEDDRNGGETPTLFISTVDQIYAGTLRAEDSDNAYVDVDSGITFTVNGSGNALQWDDATSAFFKQGEGTLALDKASSGNGLLTIEQGTVEISDAGALGGTAAGTVVESGGTLGLIGGINVTGEALTIEGAGQSGAGALANVSGDNTWGNNVTFSGDSTITNDASGSTLTIGTAGANHTINNAGFDVTVDGAGDILFNAQFSGSGGLVKNGVGATTLFFGSNTTLSTYSGTTTVNEGVLIADLGDGTFTPLTGDITVGDGIGTDIFQTRWFDNIGDSTNVRVNSSGILQVGGFYNSSITETIGSLTLEGGATAQSVNPFTGVSTIQLNGDVTRLATGNTTANINGNLNLGGATRTFDVADSTVTDDLNVSATLSSGGLNKTGAGALVLSGSTANTHATTVVADGSLTLNKTAGVDAISGSVTVNGGTLLLGASNQINDATAMTLAGGDFETAGFDETLGTLTLSGSSSIDLGGGGTINFADSSSNSWSGSLAVNSWDGSTSGGGTTQIYFGNSASGLSSGQLDAITFIDPVGLMGGSYTAKILNSGEIVPDQLINPIPEPGTYLSGGLLALAVLGLHLILLRKKNE